MKRFIGLLVLCVFSAGSLASDAKTSGLHWLALVDAGEYGASWDQSAPFFQQAISQEKWSAALTQVRAPLGELLAREVISSVQQTNLPGVPKGDYQIMRLSAHFAHKASAVETLTLQKGPQGWGVVGYFIK